MVCMSVSIICSISIRSMNIIATSIISSIIRCLFARWARRATLTLLGEPLVSQYLSDALEFVCFSSGD